MLARTTIRQRWQRKLRSGARPVLRIAALALLASTAAAAQDGGARTDLLRDQRVAATGYRLARGAVADCDRIEPMTGLGLHDVSSYAERYRTTIRKAYDLTSGFGVRFVVPGSAADRAGIAAGDEIVALDGAPLADPTLASLPSAASPDRTERFTARLRTVLADRPAQVTLRHDGVTRTVALVADRGCGGSFVVAPDTTLNAWSDGSGVAISAQLVDFVRSDDELAFVIAHEMAHNILHHAVRTKGHSPVLAEFGIGAGVVKATEIEADVRAVTLMVRAGFDPAGGEAFLRRLARARGPSLAVTHPGTERRIALLRRAAAELAAAVPGPAAQSR